MVTWIWARRKENQSQLNGEPAPPDVSEPSEHRKHYLRAIYEQNRLAGQAPYAKVQIKTLGEVLWILLERGWAGGLSDQGAALVEAASWFTQCRTVPSAETPREELRHNLHLLEPGDLRGIRCTGVKLDGIALPCADLREAMFRDATLLGAGLEGTLLVGTDFSGSKLLAPDREQILRQASESNTRRGASPCAGLVVHTRLELVWSLCNLVPQTASENAPVPLVLAGMDISELDLTGVDLRKVSLEGVGLLRRERERELGSYLLSAVSPFRGVEIRNHQDVLWIRREQRRLGLRNLNLRGAVLDGAQLACIDLSHARLEGASFRGKSDGTSVKNTDLRGADFGQSSLRGCVLDDANLAGASLVGADLRRARLEGANLQDAELFTANLGDADLRGADATRALMYATGLVGVDFKEVKLTGADIRGSQMDARTSLRDVVIDDTTKLGNVAWSGTQLTEIRWGPIRRLGDERDIALAEADWRQARRSGREAAKAKRERRLEAFDLAIQAYVSLEHALRGQGKSGVAARYRQRALYLERRAARLRRQRLRWLLLFTLDLTTGYGEHLTNLARAYFAILAGFTALYALLLTARERILDPALFLQHLGAHVPEASLLSIGVFHSLGFLSGKNGIPGDYTALLLCAAAEAMIGILLQGIFIAAVTRRLLGT